MQYFELVFGNRSYETQGNSIKPGLRPVLISRCHACTGIRQGTIGDTLYLEIVFCFKLPSDMGMYGASYLSDEL